MDPAPTLGERAMFRKKLVAVAVGTILEYYDFAIFGSLVDVIATLYFPSSSELGSFLASMTVFGSAFFMRPLGGLLIGYVGDTWGRRQALELSITLMLLPSFLIGCLPPYAVGGIAVTIVLVLLRLLQGLAVGGEMVGAFIFTVESAAGNRPGLWGSVTKSTSLVGNVSGKEDVMYRRDRHLRPVSPPICICICLSADLLSQSALFVMLGLLVVTFLRHYLTEEELLTWGWRLPFFIALALALVGLRLRKEIVAMEEEQESAHGLGRPSIDVSDRSIVMQGALGISSGLPVPANLISSAGSALEMSCEEKLWGLHTPEDSLASQWREVLLSIGTACFLAYKPVFPNALPLIFMSFSSLMRAAM
jgi:MFS family permease